MVGAVGVVVLEVDVEGGVGGVDDGIWWEEWGGAGVSDEVESVGWDGVFVAEVPVLEFGEGLERAGGDFCDDASGEAVGFAESGDDVAAA